MTLTHFQEGQHHVIPYTEVVKVYHKEMEPSRTPRTNWTHQALGGERDPTPTGGSTQSIYRALSYRLN